MVDSPSRALPLVLDALHGAGEDGVDRRRSLAMTHFRNGYGALYNRCPHQGGPLGEESIEKGWLRCPLQATTTPPATAHHPRVQRRTGRPPHRGPL